MPDQRDAVLEAELRELGRLLAVPPTPDVRAAVRAALEAAPDRAELPSGGVAGRRTGRASGRAVGRAFGRSVRRRIGAAVVAVAVALASLLALSPAARAAAHDLLRFAGIDLRNEPAPGPRGTGTLPGEAPMTLAAARERVPFRVVVPSALGTPDRVAVSDDGRVVTLSYDATQARPAVRIDQFAEQLAPFFAKFVDSKLAESVDVGGRRALWVRVPHDVAYVDRSGAPLPDTVRLAARTLIWTDGATTVRLEGLATKERAIAVARTAR